MANYYESARTNYFAVKDDNEFRKEMENIDGVTVVEKKSEDTDRTLFALLADYEGFPTSRYVEDEGDWVSFELFEGGIVQEHLAHGWVCVYMGSGAEKLRYIEGYAVAFNSDGDVRVININDIYELSKELGNKITRAEY
jgi:hypothetical protein